ELGTVAKARKKQPPAAKPASRSSRNAQKVLDFPLQDRISNIWELRRTTGLETRSYGAGRASWTPNDFGQARLGALAWLLARAQTQNKKAEFLKTQREALAKAGQDTRPLWDWYYFQVVQQDQHDPRETYEATFRLSKTNDPGAQWLFLGALSDRAAGKGRR